MNILSLFDGISCGRVALERAGIQVDKYYASEVDKYAIQIAQKNYPDTIHIGSVTEVRGEDYQDIDMIIGGSPCQDLSIAKKDGKGLQGEKSGLFFEYVRLLKEVKPKYFLLENVASMKKADKEEMTRILKEFYPNTQCYLINSSLVSAQNRKRLYWTNIQGVEQPTSKNLFLKDILQYEVDESLFMNSTQIDGINRSNFRDRKPMAINKKCNTLKVGGDKKRIIIPNGRWRYLSPIECERLQTLPDGYTEGISNTQRYKAIGNGWTVDVISHIFKYL